MIKVHAFSHFIIYIIYREIVRLLLDHDASTNIVDIKGSSPLHLAAWSGNTEIVKLLLTGHSPCNVNLTVSLIYYYYHYYRIVRI